MKSNQTLTAADLYTQLRLTATGNNMSETLAALSLMRERFEGQKRHTGDPFLFYPLLMASHAVYLGLDDTTVATTLLHELCQRESPDHWPVHETIRHAVVLVPFTIREGESRAVAKNRYYSPLPYCRPAAFAKLIDSCYSFTVGNMTTERLHAQVQEMRTYLLPMIKKMRRLYPQDERTLWLLQFQIMSLVDAVETALQHAQAQ